MSMKYGFHDIERLGISYSKKLKKLMFMKNLTGFVFGWQLLSSFMTLVWNLKLLSILNSSESLQNIASGTLIFTKHSLCRSSSLHSFF